jgi:hypothetical protein
MQRREKGSPRQLPFELVQQRYPRRPESASQTAVAISAPHRFAFGTIPLFPSTRLRWARHCGVAPGWPGPVCAHAEVDREANTKIVNGRCFIVFLRYRYWSHEADMNPTHHNTLTRQEQASPATRVALASLFFRVDSVAPAPNWWINQVPPELCGVCHKLSCRSYRGSMREEHSAYLSDARLRTNTAGFAFQKPGIVVLACLLVRVGLRDIYRQLVALIKCCGSAVRLHHELLPAPPLPVAPPSVI